MTGFDIDARKVDTLAKGGSYIYRIAAEEVQAAKTSGFEATADFSQLTAMDAIIICVPTPLNEYHEPDLSYITDTTHSIAPHLRAGQLVVLESTTYPGTTEEVMIPILEKENKSGLKAARNEAFTGKEFSSHSPRNARIPATQFVARRDIPKVVGRVKPASLRTRWRPIRLHLQSNRSRVLSSGCGNDQTSREHLPLRQHRFGERTQAVVPAHGNRYLGSD